MIKKIFKLLLLLAIILASMLIYNETLYFTGWKENPSTPDNKAPVRFYVVNLDRQPERFSAFKAQADKFGLNVERVSATDGYKVIFRDHSTKDVFTGQDIKDKTKAFVPDHKYDVYCNPGTYEKNEKAEFVYEAFKSTPRGLTAGEIGVSCSHRLLWKWVAASAHDQISVIFEDDAVLLDGFDKHFVEFMKALPDKWDIAYLDADLAYAKKHVPYSLRFLFLLPNLVVNNYFIKVHNEYHVDRMHSYVISKESAQKLIDAHTITNSVVQDTAIGYAIQTRNITAYISKKKLTSYNDALGSEISAMGRKEFGN